MNQFSQIDNIFFIFAGSSIQQNSAEKIKYLKFEQPIKVKKKPATGRPFCLKTRV